MRALFALLLAGCAMQVPAAGEPCAHGELRRERYASLGPCLPRRPIVDDDGLARCEITEQLAADAPVARCVDLPGRAALDSDDPRRCRLLQRRDGPGWFLRDAVDAAVCDPDGAQLEVTVDVEPGSLLVLTCQTVLGDAECE